MDDLRDPEGSPRKDLDEGPHVGFGGIDESEDPMRLGAQVRSRTYNRTHIDLNKDDYKPEEVARLLGTTLEVVMRAIYDGELKANRQGRNVVCIEHADLADWLARRGPGV